MEQTVYKERGGLYAWSEIDNNEKEICPKGWEIPSKGDWLFLQKNIIKKYNPDTLEATYRDVYAEYIKATSLDDMRVRERHDLTLGFAKLLLEEVFSNGTAYNYVAEPLRYGQFNANNCGVYSLGKEKILQDREGACLFLAYDTDKDGTNIFLEQGNFFYNSLNPYGYFLVKTLDMDSKDTIGSIRCILKEGH